MMQKTISEFNYTIDQENDKILDQEINSINTDIKDNQ